MTGALYLSWAAIGCITSNTCRLALSHGGTDETPMAVAVIVGGHTRRLRAHRQPHSQPANSSAAYRTSSGADCNRHVHCEYLQLENADSVAHRNSVSDQYSSEHGLSAANCYSHCRSYRNIGFMCPDRPGSIRISLTPLAGDSPVPARGRRYRRHPNRSGRRFAHAVAAGPRIYQPTYCGQPGRRVGRPGHRTCLRQISHAG